MFGTDKLNEKHRKAKKRHGAAFWVIGLFTFAIESMLGINAAFLVDQSIAIVAKNMLDGTPLAALASVITLIVSLAVGFCFIFGGMWTFSGFMDSLDDAKAYIDHYGVGRWPLIMVWCLEVAVVLLDFATLMFRSAYFAEKGALALFAFFIILILLPPVLGPLIHVLENTPRDRRIAKTYRQIEAMEADDLSNAIEAMDPDLRARWLDGDANAIHEHYERVDLRRQEAYDYEQQRIAEREQKKQRAQNPLATASLAQTAQATQRSPETEA